MENVKSRWWSGNWTEIMFSEIIFARGAPCCCGSSRTDTIYTNFSSRKGHAKWRVNLQQEHKKWGMKWGMECWKITVICNFGYPFSLFPRPFPGALSTERSTWGDGVICVARLTAVRRHQMAVCRAADNYIFEPIMFGPTSQFGGWCFFGFLAPHC